jgi:hypothetical protein
VEFLVKAGASLDVKDPAGKTAADWARESSNLQRFNNIVGDCYKGTIKTRPFSQVISVKKIHILFTVLSLRK